MSDSQQNSREGIDFISAPPPPGESVDELQALVDQQAEKKEDPEKDAEVKQQAAEALLYTQESLSRKKIQELQEQQDEIHERLSAIKEVGNDPEEQLARQDRRDALEKKRESLHQEKIEVSKKIFAQLHAIKWHLEKQENKTLEQEERLKKITKEIESIYTAVRYVELEEKIQRSESEQQEMEKLATELSDTSIVIARNLVDDAIAGDMDVKHPIDLDKDNVVREYNGWRYQVGQTQDIVDGLEEKLQQEPEKMQKIRDRVGRIRDAFAGLENVSEDTMGVLENMIWRYASNNVDKFSGEKEYPFLAQDVSTKQAFIYYPNGQVEVSRAFHGSGPIGNVPESYGSSLGSKWLEKGHTGGDYRYRLYMHGLEKGVNDKDHGRMNRVHEKSSGNTIGCTGLPPAVMARFHAAVSQAGWGFQETFISNGSPVKEQLLPGLRSSGGSVERATWGPSFSDRSEMEQFLAALDRNPLAKLMFAFIAPFGLMVAQAKGDKVMEEFWNRILGNEVSTDASGSSVSGGSRQQSWEYSRTSGNIQTEYSPSVHPNETTDQLKETDSTVEVRITKEEAMRLVAMSPEEQEKRRTLDGKTVIFKVFKEGEKKKGDDFSAFNKRFIAIHGTASLKKQGNAPNTQSFKTKLDTSALNVGIHGKEDKKTWEMYSPFAYLVSQNGLVFNFFDDKEGHGAVNSGIANGNVGISDFNSHGVAIELSLAWLGNGNVERPNDQQKAATKALVRHLRWKYDIGRANVITSADPVRDPNTGRLLSGAHGDDFSDEDRASWDAPTQQEVRNRLFSGNFFSDSASRNPKVSDDHIIDTIQRNEMGGDRNGPNDAGLITQNRGENFPSLGIGHFVWGAGQYGNSFHEMIQYIQKERGVKIDPDLSYILSSKKPSGHHSTWPHREKLMQLLQETKHDQLAFIKHRLTGFRQKNLSSSVGKRNFDYLYENAPVILLDYVNFKWEGNNSWVGSYGLQNVLETMGPATSASDAVARFQNAAIARLKGRGASDWNEWWAGWTNRINRYKNYIISD